MGLGFYALAYLFVKETENKYRVIVVATIGILCLLGSITVIGGFGGMPFGVLSLGILSMSILLAFFGKSLVWKKSIYAFVLLFVVLYSAIMYVNQTDYWIVKKTHYSTDSEVNSYIRNLQSDPTIRGYETFTISEGNKGIVLSLGGEMAGNNIEVLDVTEYSGTTAIKIRTFYNKSTEKNPVIMIGLDRLQSEIVIMDTDGTIYGKATNVQ